MSSEGQTGESLGAPNSSKLEMARATASIYGSTTSPINVQTSGEKGTGTASISPLPSPTQKLASGAGSSVPSQKKDTVRNRKRPKVKKTLRRVSVVTKENVDLHKAKVAKQRSDSPKNKHESNTLMLSFCSKRNINTVLNHTAFTMVDALLTFYVLLIPNFQDLFVPVSADEALYSMNILVFLFFLLEVFVLTYAEAGYAPRTYFWLDVVATASLIVDMVPPSSVPQRTLTLKDTDQELINVIRLTEMVGRLGRTVRLVRLFRQLRVLNVLMRNLSHTGDGEDDVGKTDEEKKKASKMVSMVSDRMSRRVVIIILVSVVTVMLLEVPKFERSREDSIRLLASAAENGTTSQAYLTTQAQMLELRKQGSGKLLELVVNNYTVLPWEPAPAIQQHELRFNQWERLIIYNDDTGLHSVASFDLRVEVMTAANYNIGMIVAITFILFFFAVLLSWDSVQLIQGPFTKMVRAENLSQALLSVFKMVAQSNDINTVSSSVVKTAHKLLRCQRVNLYFVESISKQIICMHSSSSRSRSRQKRIWSRASGNFTFRTFKTTSTLAAADSNRASGSRQEKSQSIDNDKRVSNLLIDQDPAQFESFSISLSETQYIPVQVANNGKIRNISEPTACFIGHEYESKSTLVIPVRNAANKIVAVVEAVNKEGTSGFGKDDGETLRLFCDQLGAVIGKKALDAVYANMMSNTSSLDDTARSLLQMYSGSSRSGANTPTKEDDVQDDAFDTGKTKRKVRSRQSSLVIAMDTALSSANDEYHTELVKYQTGLIQAETEHLDALMRWDTHLFDYTEEELAYGFVAMMMRSGLLSEFNIPRPHLLNYIFACREVYADITYHNFHHGFNVFQVCYKLIGETGVGELLETRDQLGLLLGAISHDLGHRGMNNSFHKAMYMDDPLIPKLALTYNDVAVLENMHASRAFEIMIRPKHGVFSNLSAKDHNEVRRMMCRGILATDMEHHMDHVKELQNHSSFTNSREDRTFLVEISMHTSDLSNPVQPWRNSSDWAIRVAKEFVIQYKKETELGLPQTPHFNLQGEMVVSNPNIAKLNIGFVNYLVKPLWVTFVDFFPKWANRIDVLDKNILKWQRLQETPTPEEKAGE